MGVDEHRAQAHGIGAVRFSILTTSDTRTRETDTTGRFAHEALAADGHSLVEHRLVRNDPAAILQATRELLAGEVDLLLITGGTGISRKDVTIAAVAPLLDRVIPGFGELFRSLSLADIGPAAMISGAILGVAGGRLLCCLPGSQGAMRLALSRLILPELRHLVAELRK